MEKKGARLHAGPAGQRNEAQRGSAPACPPARRPTAVGPAAPGGRFPAPPLLCSFLHGLLLFLLLLRKPPPPPPPRLPCPFFLASPCFLGSAFGWTLPQELGRVQGLFRPLSSLSPSTIPLEGATPSCSAPAATCRVVSVLQTGHLPAHFGTLLSRLPPRAPGQPSAPRPPLLAPPVSCAPAPWAVWSSVMPPSSSSSPSSHPSSVFHVLALL